MELVLEPHSINEYDFYVANLLSIEWTENEDCLMHGNFQEVIEICHNNGRQTASMNFLNISEGIILLLQKMAVNEIIF